MSLVDIYEEKIRQTVIDKVGEEKILEVYWEPDAGRAVFVYRGEYTSRTGRTSTRWQCFKMPVTDDCMLDALDERGVTLDMWSHYLGVLIDSIGLDFEDLMCPAPFGEFGIVDDRFVEDPPGLMIHDGWMDTDSFDYVIWWDDFTTQDEFLDELAGKIKELP